MCDRTLAELAAAASRNSSGLFSHASSPNWHASEFRYRAATLADAITDFMASSIELPPTFGIAIRHASSTKLIINFVRRRGMSLWRDRTPPIPRTNHSRFAACAAGPDASGPVRLTARLHQFLKAKIWSCRSTNVSRPSRARRGDEGSLSLISARSARLSRAFNPLSKRSQSLDTTLSCFFILPADNCSAELSRNRWNMSIVD